MMIKKQRMLGFYIALISSTTLVSGATGEMEYKSLQQKKLQTKVFDRGTLTSINGNNLHCYFNGKGLHQPYPEFLEIKVFEFNGKEYIPHGSLRELRNAFSEDKTTQHCQDSKKLSSSSNNSQISKSTVKEIMKEVQLRKEQQSKRRKIEDFVESNDAIYCEGIIEFFNRDGEYKRTGAIVLGTQKIKHCEELAEYVHEAFCKQVQEKMN